MASLLDTPFGLVGNKGIEFLENHYKTYLLVPLLKPKYTLLYGSNFHVPLQYPSISPTYSLPLNPHPQSLNLKHYKHICIYIYVYIYKYMYIYVFLYSLLTPSKIRASFRPIPEQFLLHVPSRGKLRPSGPGGVRANLAWHGFRV